MEYIVIEGVDNCGKSTIIKELNKRLFSNSIQTVLLMEEPNKTLLDGKLRDIILNKEMDCFTRELLFIAERNENLINNVKLYKGIDAIIISDRNYMSQMVYCGERNFNMVTELNMHFFKDYKPDITFIINVGLETLYNRAIDSIDSNLLDSIDKKVIQERIDDYQRVGQMLQNEYKHTIFNINGNLSINFIVNDILTILYDSGILE